jgi:dTDP-4-amino-4,6-dideoxy-D-galactose acyltransferase
MTGALASLLPWDTAFFGHRIARVAARRLDPELVARLERWSATEAIECLYLLADPTDKATSQLAEEAGFDCVGERILLAVDLAAQAARPAPAAVRPAAPDDLPALRQISRLSYHDTRFYRDPHFDRQLCDELYVRWLEASYANAEVLVCGDASPQGYISCECERDREPPTGRIGLLAVDAGARGRGYGGALVAAALSWLRAAGMQRVEVVTQGSNATAQRVYQRHGFQPEGRELWYHKWMQHHPSGCPA